MCSRWSSGALRQKEGKTKAQEICHLQAHSYITFSHNLNINVPIWWNTIASFAFGIMLSFRCALVVLVLAVGAVASSGDSSSDFQRCVTGCSTHTCLSSSTLPFALQLTRWTCTDDCNYKCMHAITDRAIQQGDPIQQYFGKWPFWRFGGMQEPASVAFSLFNLWFYARGALEVRKRIPDKHPMKSYYFIWSLVCMNAWIWSSVFHTRGELSDQYRANNIRLISMTDLPLTEKLDYFSAALSIGYGLYYTAIRLFHLYPLQDSTTSTRSLYWVWSFVCIFAYFIHVSYLMLLPRFDYSYNMAFNLVVGLSHNALWLLYSLPASMSMFRRFPSKPKSYRPVYAGKAAIFVALTTAATSLELFDFPPWARVIDAHSLWHLSTAPIAMFWFHFLVEDALDDGWRGIKV